MSTTQRTQQLIDARRRDSQTKKQRALHSIQSLQLAGSRVSFLAVATDAAVSTWFVYNHPEVRAAITTAIEQQTTEGVIDRRTTIEPLSQNSLRAELLTAREEIRALRKERTALRQRLQANLGDILDHATRTELLNRISDLETENLTLTTEAEDARSEADRTQRQLDEMTLELDGARTAYRRLMRQNNT